MGNRPAERGDAIYKVRGKARKRKKGALRRKEKEKYAQGEQE